MNGAGERRRVAADVTHAAGRDQEEDRPAFRTDPRVDLRGKSPEAHTTISTLF